MNKYIYPETKGVVDTMLGEMVRKCNTFREKLETMFDLPYEFIYPTISDILIHSFIEYEQENMLLCDINVEVSYWDEMPSLFRITLSVGKDK